jgi:S-methylmethionine-dependent homocysteine/selenocysteine methylase
VKEKSVQEKAIAQMLQLIKSKKSFDLRRIIPNCSNVIGACCRDVAVHINKFQEDNYGGEISGLQM